MRMTTKASANGFQQTDTGSPGRTVTASHQILGMFCASEGKKKSSSGDWCIDLRWVNTSQEKHSYSPRRQSPQRWTRWQLLFPTKLFKKSLSTLIRGVEYVFFNGQTHPCTQAVRPCTHINKIKGKWDTLFLYKTASLLISHFPLHL